MAARRGMWEETIGRRVVDYLRGHPLVALALLVILVLGWREIAGAEGDGLSAQDRQILHRLTATQRATATSEAIARATALVVQPVLDTQLMRDGDETMPADYPQGPWTIGWAYNCGRSGPAARLDLYDDADSSYEHPVHVARTAASPVGAGVTYETLQGRSGHQFLLQDSGSCSWHVRIMRKHRTFPVAPPPPPA